MDRMSFPARPVPSRTGPAAALAVAGALAFPALAGAAGGPALPARVQAMPADPVIPPAWQRLAAEQALEAGRSAVAGDPDIESIEVELGRADARLRLAACDRVEAHALPQQAPLGRTRIGLRCLEGPTRWAISIPVTVRAEGAAWVATRVLVPGTELQAADLKVERIDWAAERARPYPGSDPPPLGRELLQGLAAGSPLRQTHLKARQWFAAGENVRLLARGDGYMVVGSGQALQAGLEGQTVRVRSEGGRILSGVATGERQVDVTP